MIKNIYCYLFFLLLTLNAYSSYASRPHAHYFEQKRQDKQKLKAEWKNTTTRLEKMPIHKLVAYDNALWDSRFASSGLFPKGSAVYTSSGELNKKGISAIIHAAPASNSFSFTIPSELLKMDYKSIYDSVANSVKLAIANGHSKIIIPMIGGGIFIGQLASEGENDDHEECSMDEDSDDFFGVFKRKARKVNHDKLYPKICQTIVSAALKFREAKQEIAFIGYTAKERQCFQDAYDVVTKENYPHYDHQKIKILEGDIIKQAQNNKIDVIVNAANMSVSFGGGISGTIGRASEREKLIDDEAKAIHEKFVQSLMKNQRI